MILPPNWNLPEKIVTRISKTTYGRQRAILEEGQCLLILREVPLPDEGERKGVFYWYDSDGHWRTNSPNPVPGELRKHVVRYRKAEDQLEDQFETCSELKDYFEILEHLTPLKRAASNMLQALQHAREGIGDNPEIIEARDLAYDIARDCELLLEDVKHTIELRKAGDLEKEAEFSYNALVASHRLNTLAAFTFPLMAISGLLGVNLPSGLEDSPILLFWAILGSSLIAGFLLKTWVNGKPSKPKS